MPVRQLAAPVVNGVVLRVAAPRWRLETLLWRRSVEPERGRHSLPGGFLRPDESLAEAMGRQLEEKVGVTAVGHLEQLVTVSSFDTHPSLWLLDTGYLVLLGPTHVPDPEHLPPDTSWHAVDDLPDVAFGHAELIARAHERLRGKLSYSNIAVGLAPEQFTLRELAALYRAVLGYAVAPTNLGRVLSRDGLLATAGAARPPSAAGGRPARQYRFACPELTVSRPLAAFRPPVRTGDG